MTLIADVFPKLRTSKTWLDQCLKSPLSEDPSKNNMIKAPTYCSNLKECCFTILVDHWEGNCLAKSPC